jgi:hypothetical protein
LLERYWKKKPKPDLAPNNRKKARTSRATSSSAPATQTQSGSGKRGRPSGSAAATSKSAPAVKGSSKGKANDKAASAPAKAGRKRKNAPVEEVSDEEPGFDQSHVDSVEKYKDVADWENKVLSIDTVERGPDGVLQVYMTM